MSKFKVGDVVRLVGDEWGRHQFQTVTVTAVEEGGVREGYEFIETLFESPGGYWYRTGNFEMELYLRPSDPQFPPNEDATDPNYYKFPSGAEVRQISTYLTGNGAQALQYVARSCRLDGNNKGEPKENLKKAIRFLEWEIERLETSEDND